LPGRIVVKAMLAAPAPRLWSMAGVAGGSVVLMLAARFVPRPPFFEVARERC